ncbi:Signal peptidase I [Vibrio stylophorae]|uniref:Signal peptidase I n=1 Tax=Vibrio stylophorae TaxID=659351 RepID=A0ABM8ZVK2_9VIBR|nr:signal peptidase I [Vibrio stylophorae]CAH0534367.1 Signal peptidase I [Vibrio stylophorae]
MANTFSLILTLLTLATGIVWALDKFRFAPARALKRAQAKAELGEQVDEKTLDKLVPIPSWIETPASVFPVLAFVLILRSFIYEPFQIPSGSMMPTLLEGDFILVEKFAYGLRDPVFRHKLVKTGEPEHGDVVVFKFPPEPNTDYIKRVIGLPGDTVRYSRDKRLCVQPKGDHTCHILPQSQQQPSGFYQDGVMLTEQTEKQGDRAYQILKNPAVETPVMNYRPIPGRGEWVVPEGYYFVMGDNRDNSFDSRFWGFVPEGNLVGKAVAIWTSFEFNRPKESVLSFVPSNIRFERIGAIE